GWHAHIVKGRLDGDFIHYGNFINLQVSPFLVSSGMDFSQVCLFDKSRELLRFGRRQGARLEIAAQDKPPETTGLTKTDFHLKPDTLPSFHYGLVFAAIVAVKRRPGLRCRLDHILELTVARQLEHCLVPNLSHLFPRFAANFHRAKVERVVGNTGINMHTAVVSATG